MEDAIEVRIDERAETLHRQALVWDNHACMPHRAEPSWMEHLALHKDAGVDVVSLNLGDADVPWTKQLEMARHFASWVEDRPDDYALARTVAEIRAAKRAGRLAVVFDVEGGKALEGRIDRIETLHALGVKWIALVYNRGNLLGGGVHDADDTGLTAFGRDVVREMQRTGITVCCSHTGYRTAHEVFDIAERPVIFSHSNPRAMFDHPRNIPDDLITRCAESGGVVGINGLSVFLGSKERLLERFLANVEYVAELVGPRHVGIGLDYVFDKADMDAQLVAARGTWPEGYGYEPGVRYMEPTALPLVTAALLARGWSDEDVTGVLGANFLRVAEATW